jgi:large subunit ribosomal protein L21
MLGGNGGRVNFFQLKERIALFQRRGYNLRLHWRCYNAAHDSQEQDKMYAVIKSGGKQYRVAPGDQLKLESLAGEPGAVVSFDEVLMVANGDSVKVGAPTVAGGVVKAEIVGHGRGDKIRIIKHRRRKHYHKEQGHRQNYTQVKITEILGA